MCVLPGAVGAVGHQVSEVKPGDTVIYHPYGLLEVEIDGEPTYRLASVDAIEAILL